MKRRNYVHDDLPDQMTLWEMTGVVTRDSGVKPNLWISPKAACKHGPRVKVSNVPGKFDENDSFSLSIEHEPQVKAGTVKIKNTDLEDVKDWIRLNHDHLMKVWKSDTMGGREHLDGIKKL